MNQCAFIGKSLHFIWQGEDSFCKFNVYTCFLVDPDLWTFALSTILNVYAHDHLLGLGYADPYNIHKQMPRACRVYLEDFARTLESVCSIFIIPRSQMCMHSQNQERLMLP